MRLVHEGRPCAEVARILGVDERTVRGWYKDHLAGGDAALAPRPHPPRGSKLTPEQEAAVLGWFQKSPTDPEFGFPTELWTGSRVASMIRRFFGVIYNSRYILRWLRARGITPQMVQRRPRGHDPVEMDRWAAEEWPRILKKRPSLPHTSF